MIIFHVDSINEEKTFGFVDNPEKVERIISLLPNLKEQINSLNTTDKKIITILTDVVEYVLIYQKDLLENSNHIYLINYKLNIDLYEPIHKFQLFSDKLIGQIKEFQSEIKKSNPKPFQILLINTNLDEFPTRFEGIFSCNINEVVVKKAKELGAFFSIENIKKGEFKRITFVDELIINENNNKIVNVYCFIHFGNYENEKDNGYTYLKWNDLANNLDKIDLFEKAIEPLVGKIDKFAIIEKIKKHNLN